LGTEAGCEKAVPVCLLGLVVVIAVVEGAGDEVFW
jgi:hypothetical protein